MRRFLKTSLFILGLALCVTGFDIVRSNKQSVASDTSNIQPSSIDKTEQLNFLIPASHPKTKNPSLFMSNGRQMSFNHVIIKNAHEKFPDVTACLADVETNDTPLNLLDLRWADFRNDEEVRLCVFYIADILRTSERVEDWFRAQDMEIYAYTISGTLKPPLTSRTLRGSFSEYVPQSCSIYSMFVAPLFSVAPWRPDWDVRRNAIGVQIAYMRNGGIAGVRVERGSCLN